MRRQQVGKIKAQRRRKSRSEGAKTRRQRLRKGKAWAEQSTAKRWIENLPEKHQATAHELFSKDYSKRYSAIAELAKHGLKKAIPLIKRMLEDPNSFVRLTAIEALGNLGSRGSIPLIEKRVLEDAQAYNVSKAMYVLADLGSVKSIPLMQKVLKGEFRLQRTDKIQAGLTKVDAVKVLGNLTRQKNNRFFESLDRRLGEEQQRQGYSVVLHKNYWFKVYPQTLWGEKGEQNKGARVLEIKVGGEPKCTLGFVGNSILFVQIVGKVPKRGKMYELAMQEYLRGVKPLLLAGENAYLNIHDFHTNLKPLRDRFCDRSGVLNRNKKRVKEILEEK